MAGARLEGARDRGGAFLEAAGYLADAHEAGEVDDALRREIETMLASLAPHPALVHDVRGTIIAVNDFLARIADAFIGDVAAFVGEPSGGHRLVAALSPHLIDGRGLQEMYLRRLRDALLRGHGEPPPALLALFKTLTSDTGDEAALDRRKPHPLLLRISLRRGDELLSFDALTTTLGTPMAMTLRRLRLVQLLPAP